MTHEEGKTEMPDFLILRHYTFGESAEAMAYGTLQVLADCGHDAWIAPTSIVFLTRHPTVRTLCDACVPSGELEVNIVPGMLEELAAKIGVARADQLLAEAVERGRKGRLFNGPL